MIWFVSVNASYVTDQGRWCVYVALEAFSGDGRALGALALLVLVEPVLFDGLVAFVVALTFVGGISLSGLGSFPLTRLRDHCIGGALQVGGLGEMGWPSRVVVVLKVVGSVTGASVFFSSAP